MPITALVNSHLLVSAKFNTLTLALFHYREIKELKKFHSLG
jgi:hypothetical protein